MPSEVASLLTYHVLTGLHPASSFAKTAQFVPTLLTDGAHSNVTGGQRVEAQVVGKNVEITSGLLSKSMVIVAVRAFYVFPSSYFPGRPSVSHLGTSSTKQQQDVKFDGGVIHVIDKVLSIPSADSTTAVAAGLSSLASALTSASLVSTVDGLKDVTIFAPNNAAFQAIASTAATLTVAQLSNVLTYHVVAGTVGYSSLLSNTTLKTVNGKSVTITVGRGGVLVNGAKVVTADVLVANGVVHVIDR